MFDLTANMNDVRLATKTVNFNTDSIFDLQVGGVERGVDGKFYVTGGYGPSLVGGIAKPGYYKSTFMGSMAARIAALYGVQEFIVDSEDAISRSRERLVSFAGEHWDLIDPDLQIKCLDGTHAKYQLFISRLNQFYLQNPTLWSADANPASFVWIDPDNREQSIFSYRRIGKNGEELLVYLNFLPVARENFLAAVPEEGEYQEVFNSDATEFGGNGCQNLGALKTTPCAFREYEHAINITLPAMSAVVVKKVKSR